MGMPAGVSLSHQLQPLELLLGELDRVDHARGMHGEGLFPRRLLSASGCHATTFARSLAAHLTTSGSMTRTPQFQELCLATALSSIGRCGS